MKKFLSTLSFILLNFFFLWIGSLFTTPGVKSEWYQSLHQAPWTPPGFVFGLAWFTIAITFGIVTSILRKKDEDLFLLCLISWIPNVFWNSSFFFFNRISLSGFIILLLLLIIYSIYHKVRKVYGNLSWLILPYLIWLIVANSLNWYRYFFN